MQVCKSWNETQIQYDANLWEAVCRQMDIPVQAYDTVLQEHAPNSGRLAWRSIANRHAVLSRLCAELCAACTNDHIARLYITARAAALPVAATMIFLHLSRRHSGMSFVDRHFAEQMLRIHNQRVSVARLSLLTLSMFQHPHPPTQASCMEDGFVALATWRDPACTHAVLDAEFNVIADRVRARLGLPLLAPNKHGRPGSVRIGPEPEDPPDFLRANAAVAALFNVQQEAVLAGVPRTVDRSPLRWDARFVLRTINSVLYGSLEAGGLGFRGGSKETYHYAANSFLGDVLRTREGLPIALCAVYAAVARRVGLGLSSCIHAIGMPGHFMLKYAGVEAGAQGGEEEGEDKEAALALRTNTVLRGRTLVLTGGEVFIDAFSNGELRSRHSLTQQLTDMRVPFPVSAEHVAPTPHAAVWLRALRNVEGAVGREPVHEVSAAVGSLIRHCVAGVPVQSQEGYGGVSLGPRASGWPGPLRPVHISRGQNDALGDGADLMLLNAASTVSDASLQGCHAEYILRGASGGEAEGSPASSPSSPREREDAARAQGRAMGVKEAMLAMQASQRGKKLGFARGIAAALASASASEDGAARATTSTSTQARQVRAVRATAALAVLDGFPFEWPSPCPSIVRDADRCMHDADPLERARVRIMALLHGMLAGSQDALCSSLYAAACRTAGLGSLSVRSPHYGRYDPVPHAAPPSCIVKARNAQQEPLFRVGEVVTYGFGSKARPGAVFPRRHWSTSLGSRFESDLLQGVIVGWDYGGATLSDSCLAHRYLSDETDPSRSISYHVLFAAVRPRSGQAQTEQASEGLFPSPSSPDYGECRYDEASGSLLDTQPLFRLLDNEPCVQYVSEHSLQPYSDAEPPAWLQRELGVLAEQALASGPLLSCESGASNDGGWAARVHSPVVGRVSALYSAGAASGASHDSPTSAALGAHTMERRGTTPHIHISSPAKFVFERIRRREAWRYFRGVAVVPTGTVLHAEAHEHEQPVGTWRTIFLHNKDTAAQYPDDNAWIQRQLVGEAFWSSEAEEAMHPL